MTLKTRILILNAATLLLVSVTLILSSKLIQDEIVERFESGSIENTRLLWNTILENQMDSMEANVTALARDRDTRNALRDQNAGALSESIKTSYNLLSASNIVTSIQLSDPQGKIIASIPDNRGANQIHTLVKSALQQGKVVRGIVSIEGKATIAVAFPLYIRGQVIGGGIYSLELTHAVDTLKKRSDSEVVILDADNKILHATDVNLYNNTKLDLPDINKGKIAITKVSDHVYSTSIQAVLDYTKQPAARLLTIKDYTESYQRQSHMTWISYLVTTAVITGMLLLILWYTNRSFRKLHAVINVIKSVATGDLTHKLQNDMSTDETGQLATAMDTMIENLSFMVTEINSTAAQLASASETLSTVTRETHSGTERQLSETDQAATAINELAFTAQEVANNASDVANAANEANIEAQHGSSLSKQLLTAINEQVQEVNNVDETLKRLQAQSLKINEVVNVITGIAEQINLLALNAAIEAARAGEQGRGFAVVADEVRTLATRTQSSTTEISETIHQLQNEANTTVSAMGYALTKAKETETLVIDSSKSLQSIASAVDTINNMITQIATATEEQTSVTEEVNINVTSIKGIAEQVANGASQATRATEEISSLASQLEKLISKFKVG